MNWEMGHLPFIKEEKNTLWWPLAALDKMYMNSVFGQFQGRNDRVFITFLHCRMKQLFKYEIKMRNP